MCSEQQPKVRGWLMASVDGQTTGLVPANYVKVLGKRRGRKYAETVKLQQVQQDDRQALQTQFPASPQSQDFNSGFSLAPSAALSEELLESVYAETPPSTRLTKSDVASLTCDAIEWMNISMQGCSEYWTSNDYQMTVHLSEKKLNCQKTVPFGKVSHENVFRLETSFSLVTEIMSCFWQQLV